MRDVIYVWRAKSMWGWMGYRQGWVDSREGCSEVWGSDGGRGVVRAVWSGTSRGKVVGTMLVV